MGAGKHQSPGIIPLVDHKAILPAQPLFSMSHNFDQQKPEPIALSNHAFFEEKLHHLDCSLGGSDQRIDSSRHYFVATALNSSKRLTHQPTVFITHSLLTQL